MIKRNLPLANEIFLDCIKLQVSFVRENKPARFGNAQYVNVFPKGDSGALPIKHPDGQVLNYPGMVYPSLS